MNGLFIAMTVVAAARLVAEAVLSVLWAPVAALERSTPSSNGGLSPRLARFRQHAVAGVLGRLPGCVEHRSGLTFMIGTTAGAARLDNIAECIPDRIIGGWLWFGTATVAVFLFTWAVILLGIVTLVIWAGLGVFEFVVVQLQTMDWATLLDRDPTATPDLTELLMTLAASTPEILAVLSKLVVVLIVSIAATWLMMLPFIPGLFLHEFGHYAAARRYDIPIEQYGLILLGPFLGGAFVGPDEGVVEARPMRQRLHMVSAGIASQLLWGSAMLLLGILLLSDPVGALASVWTRDYAVIAANPVSAIMFYLGAVEVLNGFLNAFPGGPVDGGLFIQAAEDEYWGFDEDDGVRTRVTALLNPEGAEPP